MEGGRGDGEGGKVGAGVKPRKIPLSSRSVGVMCCASTSTARGQHTVSYGDLRESRRGEDEN